MVKSLCIRRSLYSRDADKDREMSVISKLRVGHSKFLVDHVKDEAAMPGGGCGKPIGYSMGWCCDGC